MKEKNRLAELKAKEKLTKEEEKELKDLQGVKTSDATTNEGEHPKDPPIHP